VDGWRAYAQCQDVGAEIFHGSQWRKALTICSACSVREPCLWLAMQAEEDAACRCGVWGGTTPAERHTLAASLPHGFAEVAYRSAVGAATRRVRRTARRGAA